MDDVAALHEPTDGELRRWFEQNTQRFALPNLVTFRHLYFSPDLRGTRARDDAADALRKLVGRPDEAPEVGGLADRFMFQDFYAERSPDQVAGIFGTSFAHALSGLKEGQWQGPIESGLGWHLVWVELKIPGRVPAFEEIRATIRSEWMDEERADAKRRMFETMRARYQIVLPKAPAAPAGAVAHAAAASRSVATGALVFARSLLCMLLAALANAMVAQAHESHPAYLEINEAAPGRYEVLWRTPINAGMRLPVVLKFPDNTRNLIAPSVKEFTGQLLERRLVDAGKTGLAGKRIEFVGLQATITDVLVRVQALDDTHTITLVHPSQPWVEIAASQGIADVAGAYLGIERVEGTSVGRNGRAGAIEQDANQHG